MLRSAFRWLTPWHGTRLRLGARALAALCVAIVGGRGAVAAGTGRIMPLLAQESSGEGGYPILEWAIVVLLIGVALFGICRSSRRN
jgi:hypothetical protein